MSINPFVFSKFINNGINVIHLHSANQHTKLQVNSSFLTSKMDCFYLQKHTNYDVRFQPRFLLFLGVVRKNKWHHWIPEEKLVQMPVLPPVPIRRYRLHASIHGRHPLSPEAKLVMHCGSCSDALWVTADAAAGARPGAPATRW